MIVDPGSLSSTPSPGVLEFSVSDNRAPSISLLAASARSYSHGGPRWLRDSAKFFLRSLRHPRLTRTWLDRLYSPFLEPLWRLRPRLAQKLQRPHLCFDTPAALKLQYLEFHYTLLPRLLSSDSLTALYADQVPLIELHGLGDGRILDLQLCYRDQYEMEGEMSLVIVDRATSLCLVTMSFACQQLGGRSCLFIGGVQSANDPRTRELIHDVSKEMHGMRPKALAVWCLQQFAQSWGLERLRAVSDARHVYRHSRKRHLIHSSYDEFWAECDALPQSDGLWELPLVSAQRSRAELKPSRRKQYERRYAMLDELAPAISGALEQLRSGGPHPRSHSTSVPRCILKGREQAGPVVGNVTGSPIPIAAVTDHSF